MSNAFFYDLLASVADRGRSMLKIKPWPKDADNRVEQLVETAGRWSRGGAKRRGSRSPPRSLGATARSIRPIIPRSSARSPTISGPIASGCGAAIANFGPDGDEAAAERNSLRLRASPSRIVPAAQSRAGRHRRAGRDARGPAPAREPEPVARHRRSRFSASVRFVVQSRLSGVAPHRLVLAGGASRKDHPLRGGARNRRLGRSQAAHRSGRPALLRVLPSEAGRRAADLRRGRADRRPAGGDCAAARRKARAYRAREGARGDVLFDLQLPAGPRPGQFRQFPHQAGGRGDPPRIAGDRELRHAVAGSGFPRLAGDDRGSGDRAAEERRAAIGGPIAPRTIGRRRQARRRGCAPRSSRSPPITF